MCAIEPDVGAARRSSFGPILIGALFDLCCKVQTKAQSQAGRNISLIGKAHEEKEARQNSLGARAGHYVDVPVKFLA